MYRHVILADVHAVGAHPRGDVGPVVDDEQGAVRVADVGGDAGGFEQELVLQPLLAQLHDIDAARDRLREEVGEVAFAR